MNLKKDALSGYVTESVDPVIHMAYKQTSVRSNDTCVRSYLFSRLFADCSRNQLFDWCFILQISYIIILLLYYIRRHRSAFTERLTIYASILRRARSIQPMRFRAVTLSKSQLNA